MDTSERAPERVAGSERSAARPGGPPLVLVADDELGTTLLVSDMLVFAGFAVVQAFDGVEALLRARERRPALALLDVMMPGLDGREVCRRIRADPELEGVRVVLHSSADESDVAWREAGADAFVQKPFAIRELPLLIDRLLGRA